jgi:hypothetical protein
VDLQVVTSPRGICRLLFMVVGPTLTGISAWSSRRGGYQWGMTVNNYDQSGTTSAWWVLSEISLGPWDLILVISAADTET